MKKLVFGIIEITTLLLLLCCAYYLGTTQTVSEIPEGYIDINSVESVIETKDGFEIYTNDGNVFFFDCVK